MCALSALLFLFAFAILFVMPEKSSENAHADSFQTSVNDFNFTLKTDENGESAYQIALKATLRPTVTKVIIPSYYNNIPVTEIANGGFLSCTKLETVLLPITVSKIGMNAFMNCTSLKNITLPRVESIGNNAFGMCAKLDKLFIPNSVRTVGATILRNNTNKVYVQRTYDEIFGQPTTRSGVSSEISWSLDWNDYYTGQIIYGAEPEDIIQYKEIYDPTTVDTEAPVVIGYEIADQQLLSVPDDDLVIYSSVLDAASNQFKPVLNIDSEAFILSQANSITFRHRHIDYENAEVFTHKINLLSSAFNMSFIPTIIFETGITLDHPAGGGNYTSSWTGEEIAGDANGRSTNIFQNSSVTEIVLPADLNFIGQGMFWGCGSLEKIKLAGQAYENKNILPQVSGIGSKAFADCGFMDNIYIAENVVSVGEAVFDGWGTGEKTQEIDIDFYEDEIPAGWAVNWLGNVVEAKVQINYKALSPVILDLQDGTETSVTVNAKPDEAMPEADQPVRIGYTFKGFYSQPGGAGNQYYNEEMESVKNYDGIEVLYAHWQINTYTITYSLEDWKGHTNTNPTTYTVEDLPLTITSLNEFGYEFEWSLTTIPVNTAENITVTGEWSVIEYTISYSGEFKGQNNPNPSVVTVESIPLTLTELEVDGFNFTWSNEVIDLSDLQQYVVSRNIPVSAGWTPKEYHITFETVGGGQEFPLKQVTYTYEVGSLPVPEWDGHGFLGWNTEQYGTGDDVAADDVYMFTTNITLYAQWDYTVTFSGYLEEPIDSVVGAYNSYFTLPGSTRTGYVFKGWMNDSVLYLAGTTYFITENIEFTARWEPMEFTLKLHYNDGTSRFDTLNATYGELVVTPQRMYAPTRIGYKCTGFYYTSPAGIKVQYLSTQWINYSGYEEYVLVGNMREWAHTDSTDLYAQWELLSMNYTVNFYKLDENFDYDVNNPFYTKTVSLTHNQYTVLNLSIDDVPGYNFFSLVINNNSYSTPVQGFTPTLQLNAAASNPEKVMLVGSIEVWYLDANVEFDSSMEALEQMSINQDTVNLDIAPDALTDIRFSDAVGKYVYGNASFLNNTQYDDGRRY
jgi:Ig domain protein group 2 domain protein